jgi:hypothetical protein
MHDTASTVEEACLCALSSLEVFTLYISFQHYLLAVCASQSHSLFVFSDKMSFGASVTQRLGLISLTRRSGEHVR